MKAFVPTVSISLMSLVLGPLASARAGELEVPRTGQVRCFDEAGGVVACGGTGQDGDLRAGVEWPSPRFRATGVGVGALTDLLTGLVWLSDGNCIASNYPEFDEDTSDGDPAELGDGLVTWSHCLDFVTGVNDRSYVGCGAGFSDWRLSNVVELETLVHADTADVTWLEEQGFTHVAGAYWSSTTHRSFEPANAWFVALGTGAVTNTDKMDLGACLLVRAGSTDGEPDPRFPANVWRTGQTTVYQTGDDGDVGAGVAWPTPRFSDHADGTVTDELTGLMWLEDANCVQSAYADELASDGRLGWHAAIDFVAGLDDGTYAACAAGYTDWRLPNRRELFSLTDLEPTHTVDGLPVGHPFDGLDLGSGRGYWSATTYPANPSWAFFWEPRRGDVVGSPKTDLRTVWPVRRSLPVVPEPNLELDPAAVDFGAVPVTSGEFRTVTLSNTGGQDLEVANMSSSPASAFPLVFDVGATACGSNRPTLGANASCTLRVQFLPTQVQTYDGTLTVTSNDPDTPTARVSLTGQGAQLPAGPHISVSPPSHDFGTVAVGNLSALQIFEIHNLGDAALEVSRFADQVAEEFPQRFDAGSEPCGPPPFTVGASRRCTVGITFAPRTVGAREGWIQVHSNDPLHPSERIVVTGYANPPDDEGGCGCRTASTPGLGDLAPWALVLFVLAARRRS